MFRSSKPILLGSGSPRRREFLEHLGLSLVTRAPDVDETAHVGESPSAYLNRIVAAKLAMVRAAVVEEHYAAIIVADTSVIHEGCILGKPTNSEDALRMLRSLRGATHQVMTRYAIASGGSVRASTVTSGVTFRELSDAELFAYVGCGEGIDKAGAYAIQGRGAHMISSISGSYSSIVGLPVAEVVSDLLALRAIAVEAP
jgi:septum formation protein